MKRFKHFVNIVDPEIGPLNLEELKNNFDEKEFGKFQDKIDRNSFDLNLSKSLYLNGEVIGGCLVNILSLNDVIDSIKYWVNNGLYSNYKQLVPKSILYKYKGKVGVYSDFIYIKEEYRNNGYVNIILNYENTLGDYVWGINSLDSINYFTNVQNRIKIVSYEDEYKYNNIISATKL